MPRANRVCSCTGCPNHDGSCPEITQGGRCQGCKRVAEQRRGTARQRGYDHRHERTFREAVLSAQPLCVCTDRTHGHGPECLAPSVHADHHPRDRKELVRLGLNPYDPQYGRGTCHPCHSKDTAARYPGGWAAQQAIG